MNFHFDVNVDEDQRGAGFPCVLSHDNVGNDGNDDDAGDDENDDDDPRVACMCVCFVCALSSHIRHTPPHPLLGQDDDENEDD